MSRELKKAIDAGDVARVQMILADDPLRSAELISWGSTLCPCKTEPLHYLSDGPFHQLWDHGRQAELAAVLIEAGAPVDGLPESGETPLHGAASLGEAGVAEVLIDHGADIEAVAQHPGIPDGTPLDFAVHFGMVEVVDLLTRRGAKVLSPRMAAGAGQLDRIQADLPSMVQNTETVHDALRCATVCGRIEVVEFLLEDSVDVNTDVKGASVLHWAAWEAKPRMVEFLLSRGADSTTTDQKYNLTPHGWAKHRWKELGPRWGHDKVMEILQAD